MSHQGHNPYQHYVPPEQPQYRQYYNQQNADHAAFQPHQEQGQYNQQNVAYNPGHPQPTGGSYVSVSSLGTGNSHAPINYQVSGFGGQRPDYGQETASSAYHGTGVNDARRKETARNNETTIFEMPGESAQPSPSVETPSIDQRKGHAARTAGDVAADPTPVQANPWPFYLDPSPSHPKQDEQVKTEECTQKKTEAETEPVQAFPWPYHGPSTEEDAPRATVHPPLQQKATSAPAVPAPQTKADRMNKPLPPMGNDESVLDDILSDMDAQDAQDEDEKEEPEAQQRPAKDPSLRPPPLNISRPSDGSVRGETASGAVSPGGRTYIPYRPGASPTTSSPTAPTSTPTQQQQQQQQQQHHPLVTAPHHVYMPQNQSSLSPPPQSQLSPPTVRPGGALSPTSGSPASGQAGFSPYRPPSPQAAPHSAGSPGLGLGLGLGSPTMGSGESPGFTAYQPSQTHSGLTSPTHPASPAFPPPRQSSSPRPPVSPQPGLSPRLPNASSTGYQSPVTTALVPPYPSSPPRLTPSPGGNRPGTASSHSKPASPAPLAFYPPPTTQQAPSQIPLEHGRLASPPAGAMLSRPSSRNDSASVHSGVSSTAGGVPVHLSAGQHGRPSPTPSSTAGNTQPNQYFSPQPSPQQQQHAPAQSPVAPPSQYVQQQNYVTPTVSSPQSATSPQSPATSYPPHHLPRPGVPHSTTLPTTLPSPTSPPPPYTAIDLPPRPGSADASYQGTLSYSHPPPPASQQASNFPSQPTYAASSSSQFQQQGGRSPNLNQSLPPLPPRPSTSHNGRPPPPPPRPQQGFGSGPNNAMTFPPPPKPNYNNPNNVPPPMPPRPPHHPTSYGSNHAANKIFGSHSAKKWLDKTGRLVEQTFGDILQPQGHLLEGMGVIRNNRNMPRHKGSTILNNTLHNTNIKDIRKHSCRLGLIQIMAGGGNVDETTSLAISSDLK